MDPNTPSMADRQDFLDATRGHIAPLSPGKILNSSGTPIWNIEGYSFLAKDAECPETAHPHLWRHGQLNAINGLFEVAPQIYQLRGLDMSNMTVIESDTGLIIIDPLVSTECAAAGLALYRQHRDPGCERQIKAVVYSHSHGDHYMGAAGVLDDPPRSDVPIIAPEGFIEAVLSESVLAGPAMRRRGAFMYGNALPRASDGQIGIGIGMASSVGSTSLILPTLLVQKTGEEHVIDGVRMVFQMVPGCEAPAELNLHLPGLRALCIPEMATNCMHNITTLRGAQVRDAKAWSRYLDEAIAFYGSESDVMFCSHNWPSWGAGTICKRLSEQRDMYGYLHDQTVRMMNLGMTGTEIAERMVLPPTIEQAWHCRGFYGSLSHNVKGIYQKYMTWFDGNPAHLWQYPPAEEGARYAECVGGVDALCSKATEFMDRGDCRFAATLLAHAVAADPKAEMAKEALASAYQTLGYGAENATWRNFYLTGAQELRTGTKAGMVAGGKTPLGPNLSNAQWFEVLAVQLDGVRAAATSLLIELELVESKENWQLEVSNGVLISRLLPKGSGVSRARTPDAKVALTRASLLEALRGHEVKAESHTGDLAALTRMVALTRAADDSVRGPSQI